MADLFIQGVTHRIDRQDYLHFWGEVINRGESTQRWVKVTIRLFDADGVVLGEESDITALEFTLPQMHNPFHIVFHDPPESFARYNLDIAGRLHDADDPAVPQPYDGLRAERVHYREIGRANLECTLMGNLVNAGDAPASHCKIVGTMYDADERVISVLSPYVRSGNQMAPGDSAFFELKYYLLSGTVVRHTVQVQGRQVKR